MPINIVAVSGSLRSASTNSALARAVIASAPAGVGVIRYDGLAGLPHFSPELETDVPDAVRELRLVIGAADGVLFCTPEYAYGIPGSLKNALDWLVSSGELWRKPVAVVSASPSALGGAKAHAALTLTLTALEAKIVHAASLQIPFVSTKLNAEKEVTDPATLAELKASLAALIAAISPPAPA